MNEENVMLQAKSIQGMDYFFDGTDIVFLSEDGTKCDRLDTNNSFDSKVWSQYLMM